MAGDSILVRGRGPQQVEIGLLERLRSERDAIRADPGLLASPLVLAVPSDGLRVHVAARVAKEIGALAGVRLQTLFGLARDVLARAGSPAPRGIELADVLVRRAAARIGQPGQQADGLVPAARGTIVDLLDAGLSPENTDAVLDALDSAHLAREERKLARDLVAAALAARADCAAHGVGRTSETYALAARALRADAAALGSRAVWVHGVADATGLLGDFLEALVATGRARLAWDDAAVGPRYGAALRDRLGIRAQPVGETAARPQSFRARGTEAEAREVLRRVRVLLHAGAVPESIAIVAHDVAPYRLPLRTHAARLAVPISAERTAGPLTPAGRRDLARLELLQDPARAPVDRWFAAQLERQPDELQLLAGWRALGAGRLGTAASLDLDEALGQAASLRLRARESASREPAEEERHEPDGDEREDDSEDASTAQPESEETVFEARHVAREALTREIARAGAFLTASKAWPDSGGIARHRDVLARVLASLGGTGPDDELLAAADKLAQTRTTHEFRLSRREFLDAIAPEVEARARDELGGRGGGVQVLTVADARGRTFEHVFVPGLNAGVFPAVPREDPLLGDDARMHVAACLPDLPQKRARPEEERALFEQLLRAAPDVTLSWLVADADDEPRGPSPLLDRAGIDEADRVPICDLAVAASQDVAQPPHEHALIAARAGGRAALDSVLAFALERARAAHGLDPALAARVAIARAAVVAELDRPPGPPESLGPFFGFVGARRAGDARNAEMYVTTVERLATCPWQTFLRRVLKIAPPIDPLVEAPSIDPAVVGLVAHELLASAAPVKHVDLGSVGDDSGVPATWPSDLKLAIAARASARTALREAGLFAPGLDELVAARALRLVEAARAVDALEPGLLLVAAETKGQIELDGDRRLHFRADRVERVDNQLRMTDWKSGSVFGGEKSVAANRLKSLLKGLARGTHLQAWAYARATGYGRYVALSPAIEDDANRTFPIDEGTTGAQEAFEKAWRALLAAWDGGALFPRLLRGDGHTVNPACATCEVALACVQGDTGARLRLAHHVARDPAGVTGNDALVRAVWDLQVETRAPAKPAAAKGRRK